MSNEHALRALYAQGWPEPTPEQPHAPRTVEDLIARLTVARQRGFAHVSSSATLGMTAVAVPIQPRTGFPAVGTVSVAGPDVRIDEKRAESFAQLLKEASRELAELWPARLHQRLGLPQHDTLAKTGS
jgi:DNA-binding IclR family transcriptional regulator